jgi:hypothetical protein
MGMPIFGVTLIGPYHFVVVVFYLSFWSFFCRARWAEDQRSLHARRWAESTGVIVRLLSRAVTASVVFEGHSLLGLEYKCRR